MIIGKRVILGVIGYVLIFLFMEVFVSSFIPAMISTFHLPQFMPIFILFLGVRWDSPYRPVYILLLNIIHASFSTEGWAIGTFLGVLLAWPLGSLREIVHFSSTFVLSIFSFFFHLTWFFLGTFVFAMKNDNYGLLKIYAVPILLKSVFLCLCTPILFKVLDSVWNGDGNGQEQGLSNV